MSAVTDGGMLLGHAQGEPVLPARRGDELFASGAVCTHYGERRRVWRAPDRALSGSTFSSPRPQWPSWPAGESRLGEAAERTPEELVEGHFQDY